ncbi:MAG: pilus assembly protein N-terminal domain-containing protein [Loktanella sp.]|nr:pilus assembly protein N-terminal domain-containing protein [Loktanella sp.]
MTFSIPLTGKILCAIIICNPGAAIAETIPITFAEGSLSYQESTQPGILLLAVMVDFASVLRIEGNISAIAVGNSGIADASLADPNTLILTGRTVGTTNLIALNEEGAVILDVMIRVGAQKPGMVTVRRGTEVQSKECNSANCGSTPNDALPQVSSLMLTPDS